MTNEAQPWPNETTNEAKEMDAFNAGAEKHWPAEPLGSLDQQDARLAHYILTGGE